MRITILIIMNTYFDSASMYQIKYKVHIFLKKKKKKTSNIK